MDRKRINEEKTMKRTLRMAGLLAITVTLSGLAGSPCLATDVSSYVKAVPSAQGVDELQAQIQRRITDAAFAGRLSKSAAQEYCRDLDRISDLEASYRASHGRLSVWETLKLYFELDNLSREMELALTDRSVPDADIVARLKELDNRVDDGLKWSRLTSQEADGFKYDLERARALSQLESDSDQIADQQAFQIGLELDKISGRLESTMHDRQLIFNAVDPARETVEKQIKDALAASKINDAEAGAARTEFQRIADREKKLKELGRPLSSDETLALALDLEKLAGRLEGESNLKGENYGDKKKKVESRIAGGIVTGKLTLPEGHFLRDQIRSIEKKEAKWLKASGKLTEEAQKALMLDLEKLSNDVEKRLLDSRFSWSGAADSIETLRKRVREAGEANRLSASGRKDLDSDIERVEKLWEGARTDAEQGLYRLDESMQVAVALDALNRKLVDSLSDRDLALPQIDQRKTAIEARIAAGITSGRLNPWEAERFLDEFDRIAERENAYRAFHTGITDRQTVAIALRLEQLSARVETAIHDDAGAMPSIKSRKQELREDIEEATISGRLLDSEAEDYRTRLKSIEEAAGDGLSARQTLKIARDLHELKISLDRDLADVEIGMPDVDKRKRDLFARISGGVTSGRLSPKEAQALRADFDEIDHLRKKYAADGGTSRGEGSILAYKIERLASQTEERMHDEQIELPSVAKLQDDLDKRLASSVASGQLTLAEVAEFKKQLDEIGRMEMGFRYTGSGLSYPETLMLAQAIDNLQGRVDRVLAEKSSNWNGIDDRLDKTAKKIADTLLAKKISIDSANSLKTELDRISKAKIAFAHSLGGYDLEETETLVRDLDRLDAEIDLRARGQNFAWSDIDRREALIEKNLAQNIKLGKLDKSRASAIKDELDKIRRAKAAFTITDGGLNYFERVSLGEALDKLDSMMKSKIK
ncbi:MAG: hypothetical protein AB7W16_11480 [Candidatus Obscuribacterales bacterium]